MPVPPHTLPSIPNSIADTQAERRATVPVPDAYGASFSFAVGLRDTAIGQRNGPLFFKVLVNGSMAWQLNVSTAAGADSHISLAGRAVCRRKKGFATADIRRSRDIICMRACPRPHTALFP
jgi:hypothetical protein